MLLYFIYYNEIIIHRMNILYNEINKSLPTNEKSLLT